MTSPNGYVPEETNPGADAEETARKLAEAFLNGGAVFENIVGLIGDALAGLFAGKPGSLGEISDGQLALKNNLALLSGVRGFCAAYQVQNLNAEWNLVNNQRVHPFTEQLGPAKGAYVNPAVPGITFESKGLWWVHATIRARQTSFTGSDEVSMFVDVLRPDGSVYSPLIVDGRPGPGFSSITATFPVVVPGPGYSVRVKSWTGRWRWWDGGTRYTRLAVLKVDNNTEGVGVDIVPDEPNPNEN